MMYDEIPVISIGADRLLCRPVAYAHWTFYGQVYRTIIIYYSCDTFSASRCPTDDVRRWLATDRGDGVPAGLETPALVVGRGESRRRRHRLGHNRRVKLSDRLARLRHPVLGRRHSAHRYPETAHIPADKTPHTYLVDDILYMMGTTPIPLLG